MKHIAPSHKRTFLALLGAALLSLTYGCNDSGDSRADPVGPNLHGDGWSGVYFKTDIPGTIPVTATINHDGSGIVIRTSLLAPPGQFLTGEIDAEGDIILSDGFDGELWTTHFGGASSNYVKIADFLEIPSIEDPSPPLQVIELFR